MTITPPATQVESLQNVATDPDGDVLFTTFPNGLPGSWNILATELTISVTPDPAAAPGDYDIVYRVTDPSGEWADATLKVTISAPTPNRPPTANAVSVNASRSQPSVATLVYSDPDGDVLVPVLNAADIPSDWTATVIGNKVTVTPSATASGTTVIRYSVTDSAGATATSQITVNICTVSLVSISPASSKVVVTDGGGLAEPVTVDHLVQRRLQCAGARIPSQRVISGRSHGELRCIHRRDHWHDQLVRLGPAQGQPNPGRRTQCSPGRPRPRCPVSQPHYECPASKGMS